MKTPLQQPYVPGLKPYVPGLRWESVEAPDTGIHPDHRALLSAMGVMEGCEPVERLPRPIRFAPKRFPTTVFSPAAARRMEAYMESHGYGQTAFATKVDATDRTLRSFRRTGKVRRDIFHAIAREMGTTPDQLLKPE
jgi:hypothetical protein